MCFTLLRAWPNTPPPGALQYLKQLSWSKWTLLAGGVPRGKSGSKRGVFCGQTFLVLEQAWATSWCAHVDGPKASGLRLLWGCSNGSAWPGPKWAFFIPNTKRVVHPYFVSGSSISGRQEVGKKPCRLTKNWIELTFFLRLLKCGEQEVDRTRHHFVTFKSRRICLLTWVLQCRHIRVKRQRVQGGELIGLLLLDRYVTWEQVFFQFNTYHVSPTTEETVWLQRWKTGRGRMLIFLCQALKKIFFIVCIQQWYLI